ncbi:hypothetical protein D9M71_450060 [compost metagenome]
MIQPPTAGPRVGASEAMAPMVEAAITRCLPVKYIKAVVNTSGIIEPPRKPCKARKAIMLWMFHASAQSRLVRVKPAADTANNQRVLITRESQPDMGMTMISAIR